MEGHRTQDLEMPLPHLEVNGQCNCYGCFVLNNDIVELRPIQTTLHVYTRELFSTLVILIIVIILRTKCSNFIQLHFLFLLPLLHIYLHKLLYLSAYMCFILNYFCLSCDNTDEKLLLRAWNARLFARV